MDLTVAELQRWVALNYPNAYEFTEILKYWVNKYNQENKDE